MIIESKKITAESSAQFYVSFTIDIDLLEQHENGFGWDEQTLRVTIKGAKSRTAQLKQKVRN